MNSILLSIYWYFWLIIIGISMIPLSIILFPKAPEKGVLLSRTLGLGCLSFLSFTAVSWFHISYCKYLLWSIVIVQLILNWGLLDPLGKNTQLALKDNCKKILAYELFGLLVFSILLTIRALNPSIIGAEKLMDSAILNSLIRTDVLPPPDPWLAGYSSNYYYWGHMIFANVLKMSGIYFSYGYQFALVTVFYLTFLHCFTVSMSPNNKERLWTGIFLCIIVCLLGNLYPVVQLVRGNNIDYWSSSRVIPYTINEFPFFSFIHGDLHAHYINLPFVLALICLLLQYKLNRSNALSIVTISCFSLLCMINPWDVPIILLLIIVFICHNLKKLMSAKNIFHVLFISSLLIVTFHPYWHNLSSSVKGVGIVSTPSGPLAVFFVWGIFGGFSLLLLNKPVKNKLDLIYLSPLVLLCFVSTKYWPGYLLIWWGVLIYILDKTSTYRVLISIALISIGSCEFLYLIDPYNEGMFYRHNTVFKTYFLSWILLGCGLSPFIAKYWIKSTPKIRVHIVLLISLGLIYPIAVVRDRVNSNSSCTLDGLCYMDKLMPQEKDAIKWLNTYLTGNHVILEAPGSAYYYTGRISSYTGLSSLLGWGNHEVIWRNNTSLIEKRYKDISLLWGTNDTEILKSLIQKYKIEYVYVGFLENMYYPNNNKWSSVGKIIYSHNSITIYKINPTLHHHN